MFLYRSKNPNKDWTEDFDMENGYYFNVCWRCEAHFVGHKRRFQCKECEEISIEKNKDENIG